ncbi:MAG: PA14 domain-containing protein [Acidobacteria bacterium]|nr:PA14 domain-containing protein [Acidobacteriota bacterium]
MRVSRSTAIGLAAILVAACGIGMTAVAAARHGLVARYYPNPVWTGVPVASGLDDRIATDVVEGRMAAIGGAGFSARWQGFLRVDHPAEYRFTVVSDDVAWLYLDGRLRVNDGVRGPSHQTATVPLAAGLHSVEVAFFTHGGDYDLALLWADGSGPAEPVAADRLFPTRGASLAYDALWGEAYLWPLTGSLFIFAALCWWPLRQVARHCHERADEPDANRVLWGLLAISFLLSVVAIGWGLPQPITWAADELHPIDVTDAVAQRFSGGWTLKYPPMQLYLLAILYTPFFVAESLGMVDLTAVGTHTALFLLARGMSVAMAVGTVYVVYLCGLQLYRSRSAGLGAAALVATMPPFVYYAKMANVDVPYLFWFALSLLFYIRIVQTDRTGDYIRFAFTAALAICTKDQAYGLYVLPVVHLVWLRARRGTAEGAWARVGVLWSDRRLQSAAVTGVTVLVLGYNLAFNWTGFIEHVAVLVGPLSQMSRMFEANVAGHLAMAWEAVGVLALCLGPPGLLVCVVGVVASVRAANQTDLFLLLPALSFYLTVISVVMYHYDRFFLGICFILALFGGKALAAALAPGRWLGWRRATVAGLCGYMLLSAVTVDVVMASDSRYAVERWLSERAHARGRVGMAGMAIYLPRVDPARALTVRESWVDVDRLQPRFIVVNRGYSCRAEPGSSAADFYAGLRRARRRPGRVPGALPSVVRPVSRRHVAALWVPVFTAGGVLPRSISHQVPGGVFVGTPPVRSAVHDVSANRAEAILIGDGP